MIQFNTKTRLFLSCCSPAFELSFLSRLPRPFVILSFFHFLLLFFQEVIDIFEGVRDDQALRMAANLGFKGPLQRQVMGGLKALKLQ